MNYFKIGKHSIFIFDYQTWYANNETLKFESCIYYLDQRFRKEFMKKKKSREN